jgi:hypothetical protein
MLRDALLTVEATCDDHGLLRFFGEGVAAELGLVFFHFSLSSFYSWSDIVAVF